MSFTADELQSFNEILEKRLTAQRQEFERALEQRLQTHRREMEQRLIAVQREIISTFIQRLSEQHKALQTTLGQKLNAQQLNVTQAVSYEIKQRQQPQPQWEGLVDRALAAQLLAIEELLNQRLSLQPLDDAGLQVGEHPPHFEAIEVQTDLPWEDLVNIFGKVLDERFIQLSESIQATTRGLEQYLSEQLHALHTQVRDGIVHATQLQTYPENLSSIQEVFRSIEQLERIIESMQVAMTANHALLSNRLYHHLQLPLERAHASSHTPSTNTLHPNGTSATGPHALSGEHGEQYG